MPTEISFNGSHHIGQGFWHTTHIVMMEGELRKVVSQTPPPPTRDERVRELLELLNRLDAEYVVTLNGITYTRRKDGKEDNTCKGYAR